MPDFFVSPNGQIGAPGTENDPWDIREMFAKPASAFPADSIIHLRGAPNYGRFFGNFTSLLQGSAPGHILLQSYPGEWATLDGGWSTVLLEDLAPEATAMKVADTSNIIRGVEYFVNNERIFINSTATISNGVVNGIQRGRGQNSVPEFHAAGSELVPRVEVFQIFGGDTWYYNFEVTNSYPERVIEERGSGPVRQRGTGIEMRSPRSKLIHVIGHDTAQGCGFWVQSVDAEIYGCIFYNNGWVGPDRGHGHGIYTQNELPSKKKIRNCIGWNNFGGWFSHQYSSGGGGLEGYLWEANFAFLNGWLTGGSNPVRETILRRNLMVISVLNVGWTFKQNVDVTLEDNYVIAPNVLRIVGFDRSTVRNNHFLQDPTTSGGLVRIDLKQNTTHEAHVFENNKYRSGRSEADSPFAIYDYAGVRTHLLKFIGWQGIGKDANGEYSPKGTVLENFVQVEPSEYTAGWAHVGIANWELLDTVDVDLSGVLEVGDSFSVWSAFDPLGEPVLTGTFDGNSVAFPMTGLECVLPIGDFSGGVPSHSEDLLIPQTPAPEKAAFIVKRVAPIATEPDPPQITTTTIPNGQVNSTYNAQLEVSAGTLPVSVTVFSGELPPGLSMNASGQISGTPTQSGTFEFTARATDSATVPRFDDQIFSVTIDPEPPDPLNFITENLPQGDQNQPYSFALQVEGGTPPYAFSIGSGELPSGISLATDGTFSGTPTVSGSFNVTILSSDAMTGQASRTFTLVVNPAPPPPPPAPDISTTSLPSGQVSVSYQATIGVTSGTGPFAWSISSGSLPPGISMNAATGILSGTPQVQGNYPFEVTVRDANNLSDVQTLTISIATAPTPPPNIVSTTVPAGTVGAAYDKNLGRHGGQPPYLWSLFGSLPAGLTFALGRIQGTPTERGTFNISVTLTDGLQRTSTRQYSLVIYALPPQVTTTTLPNATRRYHYIRKIDFVEGEGNVTFALTSGTLPNGISISDDGYVIGVPMTEGTFTFTVTATDSVGRSDSQELALTVLPTPQGPKKISQFGSVKTGFRYKR